jgi:hypothetical protein
MTETQLTDRQPATDSPVDHRRKRRVVAAFAVAGVSDLLSIGLGTVPPIQWALDLGTAGLLFLILGRQWMILPGLVAEAIPGIALFPSWLLVVGSISALGTIRTGGRS